jgi:hypothetical protein
VISCRLPLCLVYLLLQYYNLDLLQHSLLVRLVEGIRMTRKTKGNVSVKLVEHVGNAKYIQSEFVLI